MDLFHFLDLLEARKIYFSLNRIRDSILVEIAVPGQRWEVEFLPDGSIQIEKFLSEGILHDETELDVLLLEYSD